MALARYKYAMTEAVNFNCSTCETPYKLVRVEALPDHDRPLTCLSCGGPLHNREGKFALKYFRVSDSAHLRINGRQPKLR